MAIEKVCENRGTQGLFVEIFHRFFVYVCDMSTTTETINHQIDKNEELKTGTSPGDELELNNDY